MLVRTKSIPEHGLDLAFAIDRGELTAMFGRTRI